jgi:hypothetical protein
MTSPTQPTTPELVANGAADSVEIIEILVLPNGGEIRRELLDRVNRSIPRLDRNRTYSLKQMCGLEFWATLAPGEKIENGISFAYLVTQGELPLEFACCPQRSNKLYRRK